MKPQVKNFLRKGALCAWLAVAPSGCWWFGRHEAVVEVPVQVPVTRIAQWGIATLGLVRFDDAANRPDVATHVTDAFQLALEQALGENGVRVAPPGPDLGLVGVGQAQKLGHALGVQGLVTGRVLAYGWQPKLARTWVSVSIRLLETGRGTIIWSRNATGTSLVSNQSALNAALDVATQLAAKEFINDLLASPTPARARVDAGDRRNVADRVASQRGTFDWDRR